MPYRQFIAQRQYLAVTVTVLVVIMLLGQWLVNLPLDAVTLDRLAFYSERDGQPVWQIMSAHFVHLDGLHLGANLVAFVAACCLFWPLLTTTRLLVLVGLGAIGACGAAVLIGPSLSFVGFSALTHTLVAFATIATLRNQFELRPFIGWLMLIAIIIKSTLELSSFTGNSYWLAQSVAGEAHLGGLLAGAVVGLWVFRPTQA